MKGRQGGRGYESGDEAVLLAAVITVELKSVVKYGEVFHCAACMHAGAHPNPHISALRAIIKCLWWTKYAHLDAFSALLLQF